MFTNQTHRNFAGRIYFPVLITPESLSALFTFFWPALNLRPKEKLYARRMTNKRELSFKYMLLRNEAYCDLFSESCLNVFINGLKTPAPTIKSLYLYPAYRICPCSPPVMVSPKKRSQLAYISYPANHRFHTTETERLLYQFVYTCE